MPDFCSLSVQIAAVRLIVCTPPVQKNVYVAVSFNHWSAGDSLYRMH